MASYQDITTLLVRCRRGDQQARELLAERIYPQLKALAGRRLAAVGPPATFQTTELVHETYLRLLGQRQVAWRDRAHFFAIAARLMRRTLFEAIRFHGRDKRGGGREPLALDKVTVAAGGIDLSAIALEQALRRLQAVDPRAAQVVELRFLSGLSLEEVAAALGVGRATVVRDWRFAKSWLRLHLGVRAEEVE